MQRGCLNLKVETMRRRPERGAILIHVAIALLGLVAFSAFSIDHGVMMLSRGRILTSTSSPNSCNRSLNLACNSLGRILRPASNICPLGSTLIVTRGDSSC